MEDNSERRRKRAYGMLHEMPHEITKAEAIRTLADAGCFDLDPHVDRQYEDMVRGFHKACRKNRDVQQDMIPLWRLEKQPDGTSVKVPFLGRFGEMSLDQHQQHFAGRIKGIAADAGAFYYYFDALNDGDRTALQQRIRWLPPRPPEPTDDEGEDES